MIYDVVIIGGGPAGYKAALVLSEKGKQVALIEYSDDNIGGTCLNEGCIPVKSFAESAHLFDKINHAAYFGLEATVKLPDLCKLKSITQRNIQTLKQGILFQLKNNKVELFYGRASLKDNKTVTVENPNMSFELTANHIILATGSINKEVSVFPIDENLILSSRGIIQLEKLPERLLIVGGGVIGCEFASIYQAFGVSITIVEMLPALLPSEDEEISRTLNREFRKRNIDIACNSQIKSLKVINNKVEALLIIEGGEEKLETFSHALISVGRIPNTKMLGLERLGIRLSDRGFVAVNEHYQTSVDNIFAVGDIIETPMYAHTAYFEGMKAAEFLLGIQEHKQVGKIKAVPRIIFTEPQIGCVGYTEKEALSKFQKIKIYKKFFKANGKAVIEKNDTGFVKLIADELSARIIGGCIIGSFATEMIHEVALAIESGLTIEQVGNMIHGHPTLSEIIGDVCH